VQILQQAVAQIVDPPVHFERLVAPPGVADRRAAADGVDLLDALRSYNRRQRDS
jgi:hypothetical protein